MLSIKYNQGFLQSKDSYLNNKLTKCNSTLKELGDKIDNLMVSSIPKISKPGKSSEEVSKAMVKFREDMEILTDKVAIANHDKERLEAMIAVNRNELSLVSRYST